MSCIFCKIADKEFQSQIISETDSSLAFLDVNPVSPGHTLVIPKAHYINVSDTPDEILSELFIHSKKVAEILISSLGASGYNILNANGKSAQQSVFHLHLHIVPRFDNDNKNLWFHGTDDIKIDNLKIVYKINAYKKNQHITDNICSARCGLRQI